jgi:hypothetical protein
MGSRGDIVFKMRLGFTIVFNGLHHIEHGNFLPTMASAFDYWVIVEGAAAPNGSTNWCRPIPDEFKGPNGVSVDGTHEFLEDSGYPNIIPVFPPLGGWRSKDTMVNAALNELREFKNPAKDVFLWEVDVDEQWYLKDMETAEQTLFNANGDCGCFHANYFVGPGLVAEGTWGEGKNGNEYRRLWKWDGRPFKSHEPPKLENGNGKEVILPQRFNHFAYFFEEDVKFKEIYYNYTDLYRNWAILQKQTAFPQPLCALLGDNYLSKTDTIIDKY